MLKFRKINNVKVKPVKPLTPVDDRPFRGTDLYPVGYSNIYICSKKNTGKSTVIHRTVIDCVGRETQVHIFSSTVFMDPAYEALIDTLEKKGIAVYPSTSIKDDEGYDLVDDILAIDKNWKHPEEDEEKSKPDKQLLNLDEKPKKRKPKKSKYQELRRILIFDDLSTEIRKSTSLQKLLKHNRHYRYKVVIASQYINDLKPESINQLDYCLLFKCHNQKKLLEIYQKLDLSVSLTLFLKMYKDVTKNRDEYNFLYISRFDDFRKNFNEEIEVGNRDED